MRSMKNNALSRLLLLALLTGSAGCVAIFPHKPAERAVDRVLDDIFGNGATNDAVGGARPAHTANKGAETKNETKADTQAVAKGETK
jgi:hypothetical protein